MTEREFLTGLNTAQLNDAQKEYITERITKLDDRNEKRKNTPTKTQKENAELARAILKAVEGGAKLSTDLATELGVSPQKINGVGGVLVKAGQLTEGKVKIKGKGERTVYALPDTVTTDEEAEENDEAIADDEAEEEEETEE